MIQLIDLIGVPSEAGGRNGTSGGPDILGPALESELRKKGFHASYWNVAQHAEFPEIFELNGKPRGKVYSKRQVAGVANLVHGHFLTSLRLGHLPVTIGGDHSVSIGPQRAACENARFEGKDVGLVWIDAHYDSHTDKTTHSHNANGMPLAIALGHGSSEFLPSYDQYDGKTWSRLPCPVFLPENVLHLGAGTTDCEREEKVFLDTLGVRTFSAKELNRNCFPAWTALKELSAKVSALSVSFDLDAIDKVSAPAVHLRSNGGLTRTGSLWLCGEIAKSGKLRTIDLVEYKPSAEEFDEDGVGRTIRLARDLLLRLLGR
ncbi:MAG: hypothetical protein A3D65_02705 [Candidatus Lloydbacteria bacterium RIFCSPHIGHO2_02_FULL_50_13]|uniref:Arginase n=1 Tax=Candidatus Lloydbacteria bacterium RIFCSPHIGHO2_02_FULL_50_13 TaxID=1798661 RepID=A0A1G2D3R1_9BACT|nr:MAG: hypothetical protein A3D65_02705 [Candidatus Lloydbacteria bacterium RIFCSPHIGHO2_02_FULL_50_13]